MTLRSTEVTNKMTTLYCNRSLVEFMEDSKENKMRDYKTNETHATKTSTSIIGLFFK